MSEYTIYSGWDGKEYDHKFWSVMTRSEEVKGFSEMIDFLLKQGKKNSSKISRINIYAHGTVDDKGHPDGFYIGTDTITRSTYRTYAKIFGRKLKPYLADNSLLEFHVCGLGHVTEIITEFSMQANMKVRAYRDWQKPNWVSPKGEGPSRLCKHGKCKDESDHKWLDKDGNPIVIK